MPTGLPEFIFVRAAKLLSGISGVGTVHPIATMEPAPVKVISFYTQTAESYDLCAAFETRAFIPMERTLLIIRHAKSSWANALQTDFERPLNDRGERDAPLMGERLKSLGVVPDLMIASTAKRARQTAERIAAAMHYEKNRIAFDEELYHATPAVIETVILNLDNDRKSVFLIAHNPGITDFVNNISASFKVDNVPTCGIVGIRFAAQEWCDFLTAEKRVFLFEYPKKLYDGK